MAYVNGKKISVYDLDTKESIIERIAANLDTLPKYLILPEDFPKKFKKMDIKVKDYLAIIKKNGEKNTDFNKFIEKHPVPENLQGEIERGVLYPWLIYNVLLEKTAKYKQILFQDLEKTLVDKYFLDRKEIEIFWNSSREQERKNIEQKITFVKNDNKNTEDLYKRFEKIKEGWQYTEFKIDRTTFQITLNIDQLTIMEFFNKILLKDAFPFATCKNYYKILKDYLPSEDWSKTSEDLLVKVCTKNVVDVTKYKDFTDVILKIDQENNVKVNMRLNIERGYLNVEEFIKRYLDCFVDKITYKNLIEDEIVGVYFFPNFTLNTYVFSDLVMNDPIFSGLINIDESTKATKKKNENSQPWIYIHFNHPSTGPIAAGITQKITERSDPEIKDQNIEIGIPCIRVRARANNIESIHAFQKIFSKLLVIYEEKYDEIVQIYKKFLPNFGKVEKIEIQKKKEKITSEAPDIFVKNYSRNCTEARMPKIISKKEAKNLEENKVIAFPRKKDENNTNQYPSDGNPQKYFICPNPDYPYPGLQVNKLPNSDQYPFLPCCFKNDQTDKKGGIFRNYFFNEPLEIKEKKQQELIITDKFLGPDKFGILPEKLTKFFESLDADPNYKYIRVGVERTDNNKSSFLNCVMLAVDDDSDILDLSLPERLKLVEKTRKKLAKKDIAPMARQCAYEYDIEKLREKIDNVSEEFEAKKFVQLLENYYKCIIFLFNSEKLIFPTFTQGFYRFKRTADMPCIFIYEHMGSESDHAKYPQCELIVRWNTRSSEDIQYVFKQKNKIAANILEISEAMQKAYTLNSKIEDVVFPFSRDIINSQVIDSYGKTRQLNIAFNDVTFSVLTSPLPPLPVRESKPEIIFTYVKDAVNFMNTFNIEIISQSVHNNFVKQINGKIGNVNIYIPVEDDTPLKGIKKIAIIEYPEYETSQLEIYNNNKKMARYLTEYIFWLFSLYFRDKKHSEVSDKILANFAKNKITIEEKWNYGNITKTFSMESGMLKKGRLVVKSQEMLKRIMYVLKLYSIRDLKNLINYHSRTVITNFYEDIHDFDQHANQVILYGEDTVNKWINENRITNNLSKSVIIGVRYPYFFRNKLVGKDIYLAQNVSTIGKALYICETWKNKGYNPGPDTDEISGYSYDLYLYVNADTIEKQTIKKGKNTEFKILGYKIEGIPFFTCLLRI